MDQVCGLGSRLVGMSSYCRGLDPDADLLPSRVPSLIWFVLHRPDRQDCKMPWICVTHSLASSANQTAWSGLATVITRIVLHLTLYMVATKACSMRCSPVPYAMLGICFPSLSFSIVAMLAELDGKSPTKLDWVCEALL